MGSKSNGGRRAQSFNADEIKLMCDIMMGLLGGAVASDVRILVRNEVFRKVAGKFLAMQRSIQEELAKAA